MPRPQGPLIWVHAASVGEAQSALVLVETLLQENAALHILVTTGTRTSAELMSKKLPERAFHQFYPVDHTQWVRRFLDYWKPDGVLWMESELWPNMLREIKQRDIPCTLVNARLSPQSFKRWAMLRRSAKRLLSAFSAILCQTQADADAYANLGAHNVHVTDNLKYSAEPLSADKDNLKALQDVLGDRPSWVYASSHAPEEEIAANVHARLKDQHPKLLTIIVPRHPERFDAVAELCRREGWHALRRSTGAGLEPDHDIVLGDTMGELLLLLGCASVAIIGGSFVPRGGHNPLEAAVWGVPVVVGPHTANFADISQQLLGSGAMIQLHSTAALAPCLIELLRDTARAQAMGAAGRQVLANNRGASARLTALVAEQLAQV